MRAAKGARKMCYLILQIHFIWSCNTGKGETKAGFVFHVFLFLFFFSSLKVRLLRNGLEGSGGASLGERRRKKGGRSSSEGATAAAPSAAGQQGAAAARPNGFRPPAGCNMAAAGGPCEALWWDLAVPKHPSRLAIAVY